MDVFELKQIQPLLQIIIKALVKAVGSDTRQYILDSNLDTNNALTQLPGDFLNTNLRDMILDESVERKHFKVHLEETRKKEAERIRITFSHYVLSKMAIWKRLTSK